MTSHRGNANPTECHLPLAGMAALKKPTEPRGLAGQRRHWDPVCWWWALPCAAAVESTWRLLKTFKMELPHGPATARPGISPKKGTQGPEEVRVGPRSRQRFPQKPEAGEAAMGPSAEERTGTRWGMHTVEC